MWDDPGQDPEQQKDPIGCSSGSSSSNPTGRRRPTAPDPRPIGRDHAVVYSTHTDGSSGTHTPILDRPQHVWNTPRLGLAHRITARSAHVRRRALGSWSELTWLLSSRRLPFRPPRSRRADGGEEGDDLAHQDKVDARHVVSAIKARGTRNRFGGPGAGRGWVLLARVRVRYCDESMRRLFLPH